MASVSSSAIPVPAAAGPESSALVVATSAPPNTRSSGGSTRCRRPTAVAEPIPPPLGSRRNVLALQLQSHHQRPTLPH
eukprot:COSAG06_NODE_8_length_37897_cov_42.611884_3_plen_78_part_00